MYFSSIGLCYFVIRKTKRQYLQQELEENLDKEDLGTETDEMESLGREMLEIRCIAEDLLKGNAEERLKDVPKNMSDFIFNVRLPQYEKSKADFLKGWSEIKVERFSMAAALEAKMEMTPNTCAICHGISQCQEFIQPEIVEKDRWSLKDYVINLVANGDHRRLLHLSENTVKSKNAGNSEDLPLLMKFSKQKVAYVSRYVFVRFKLQTATTHQKENRVVCVRLRDDGQAYQLFFTLNKKMSEKICPALCRRSRLVVTPMSTQKTGKDALATTLQTPTCNNSTAERKNNSERIDLEALCVPTICGVPAKPELNAWQH
ncbi:hypothetical protein T09_8682 [Trichinella sp. T9]|nr:hypothetical protein T09_8682 [Trichinella sp. T9]